MGVYLNTLGNSRLAVGICGRCSLKFALDDLSPDPNSPGLLVCGTPGAMTGKGSWVGGYGCADMYDPYRLPPHEVENITLEFARPDLPLIVPVTTTSAPPVGDRWTAGATYATAGSTFYTAGALGP